VRSARLLTNNPAKVTGLAAGGVDITGRVPLAPAVTPYNLRYLITKRDRLGHDIQDLDAERVPSPPSFPRNGHLAAPRPGTVTAPAAEPA
jgi:3,4-dihydroxy 2-butanone 4-phosphate synthase/GTP cyclohydrolase II